MAPRSETDGFGVGRRLALGVMSGRYNHPELRQLESPAKDGEALKRVLGSPALGAFACETLLNRDVATVRSATYDFFSSAAPEDFLLFYFSGHGRKDANGRLYLCAIDTDPRRVPPTSLHAEELKNWVDDSEARRIVVILDSCFAGAFSDLRQRGSRSRIVLLAAGATEYAHEGEGTQDYATSSSFASAFFRGIETGQADDDLNGLISVREAYNHAFRTVQNDGAAQTPQMRAAGIGDLILARAPERPEDIPKDIDALLRNGIPQARELAVEQLRGWLNSGERSKIGVAEPTLRLLKNDPDERVARRAGRALLAYADELESAEARSRATAVALENEDKDWFRGAVFYQIWVRSFADGNRDGVGDLEGIRQRLPYLQSLGATCLILSPVFASPLEDDGYDVSDFGTVHTDLGSTDDLVDLLLAAHRLNIRVVLDVVLNHTSRDHPWFQASRSDPLGPYGDHYVWADNDALYAEAAVGTVDTKENSWTFDPVRKQYYWHRFEWFEPDLNYDSPAVRDAMVDVLGQWLDLGIDGFRLLTAAYLFEQDGVPSEGLAETHAFLQRLRREVDTRRAGQILIGWADKWPEEVRPYFGTKEDPECHMVLFGSLMPSLLTSVRRASHHPISSVLEQMKDPHPEGRWSVFLRSSDELLLSLVTSSEKDYILTNFAPSEKMRLGDGIRRRLAPLLEGDRDALHLYFALLLSVPGAPIIYYGDEIGMGENLSLAKRGSIRTPMQWSADRNAGFSSAEPEELVLPVVQDSLFGYQAVNVRSQLGGHGSVLQVVRRLIELRGDSAALSVGSFDMVRSSNPAVLAYLRRHEAESVLCVFNFARFPQASVIDTGHSGLVPVEMSGGARFPRIGRASYQLSLGGYGTYWLRLEQAPDG